MTSELLTTLFPAGTTDERSPGKRLTVLRLAEAEMPDFTAAAVPVTIRAYVAPKYEALGRLEKTFASIVEATVPEASAKQTRSGDLGEILGAEFIRSTTGYEVIFRLRRKEDRNLSMRGDDLLGVRIDERDNLPRYLKGEAKSYQRPGASVIAAARGALEKDERLPNPSTKAFVQARLWEEDEDSVLAKSLRADLKVDIARVEHLMFLLSGADVAGKLETDIGDASSAVPQQSVLVHVHAHATFVANVFDGVIANARA